ncbi:hypothetical protein B0H19DRAFT_1257434 [Mycena capillaripes]|nr:hypothetical protein B0H19DRAFT_1257434 [Mycena capillaripes]
MVALKDLIVADTEPAPPHVPWMADHLEAMQYALQQGHVPEDERAQYAQTLAEWRVDQLADEHVQAEGWIWDEEREDYWHPPTTSLPTSKSLLPPLPPNTPSISPSRLQRFLNAGDPIGATACTTAFHPMWPHSHAYPSSDVHPVHHPLSAPRSPEEQLGAIQGKDPTRAAPLRAATTRRRKAVPPDIAGATVAVSPSLKSAVCARSCNPPAVVSPTSPPIPPTSLSMFPHRLHPHPPSADAMRSAELPGKAKAEIARGRASLFGGGRGGAL